MKKIALTSLFTLISICSWGQVQFTTESTDAVRAQAITAGKLVFVDLHASWCPPCRQMEKDVFSREDIGEFMNSRFINAKYDVDKPLGRDLLARYAPNGAIPTFLIFNTNGDLLGRIQGASRPEEFKAEINRILDKHNKKEKKK